MRSTFKAMMLMAVMIAAVFAAVAVSDSSDAVIADIEKPDAVTNPETGAICTVDGTEYENLSDAITAATGSGKPLVLTTDYKCEIRTIDFTGNLEIDLKGHTLAINLVTLSGDDSLTIRNGTLLGKYVDNIGHATLTARDNASVVLDDVDFYSEATGAIVYNKSSVTLSNGTVIHAEGYGLGTNASDPADYDVRMTVKDSAVYADSDTTKVGTAILFNIPGTLTIENSTIQGYYQAIILRGGNAIITGSTITNTMNDASLVATFEDTDWQTGNAVPTGALIIGNRSASYQYPTNINLVDTDVVSNGSAGSQCPAVYVYANAADGLGVDFVYDDQSTFDNGTQEAMVFGTTENVASGDAVAQVGDMKYASLEAAVNDAEDKDTVTLLEDATTSALTIDDGIYLDLGGHTLTITETDDETDNRWGLTFTSGDSVITNGTIVDDRAKDVTKKVAVYVHGDDADVSLSTSDLTITTYPSTAGGYSYALRVEGNADVNLGSGTTIKETANGDAEGTVVGVAVFGAQDQAESYSTTTRLTVNNGVSINTSGYAISGNGDGNNGTVITINGGTIASTKSLAIYHPQDGALTVNGGTIAGTTGIEMRAGTLTMTGGEVTGNGEFSSVANSSGSTTSGVGIAVVQHTTTYDIAVTVKDGTVKGYHSVYEENVQENDDTDLEGVSISLKGGDYEVMNGGTQSVKIDDAEKIDAAVTGGTYVGEIENLVPTDEGIVVDDGTVTPPFSFDYLVMNVVTSKFTAPVTCAPGTIVNYECTEGLTYDAETGIFTISSETKQKTFTITGTAGSYTDTMTVNFSGEFITSADADTGLMAVAVESPDQSVYEELGNYPEIASGWIFLDISRLDSSKDPLTFTFGLPVKDGQGLFVVHFNDDGTVDYPTVEIVDGVYKITPSGFSLFAFGIYTGEGPTPEPTPEPEPEPEPEPTPEYPPAGGDDDEDLPPIIRPGGSSSSADDDTVTIVACAAAAAVAAIMAVFLIVLYRKD